MEETDGFSSSYTDIDFNFSIQKQELQSLKNKYNLNKKPTVSVSTSSTSSYSQQSVESYSSNVSETDSTKNNQKSRDVQIETNPKKTKEKLPKTVTNKKKSKYENVATIIDSDLLTTYGQHLLNELDVLEINYEIRSQICSNSVTWIYKGNELDLEESESNNVLLILNWKAVIDYVSSNSLLTHIKMVSEILSGKRITLGLYGFGNYFKFWKLQKDNKLNNKNYAEYKNSLKINRHELEYMLTELEVRHSCCHRFLENTQDIINIISQHTKSIAQLPEKVEKHDKYKNLDFYVMKDNRDCVMVDKHGNGLKRLWQQQLTTFEMVRLETAEAIMSKYSTPSQLFDAYQNCDTAAQAAKLLEDIPIRRAAGPLTTSRKIGPELSNKIFKFLSAVDGNTVL